PRRSRFAKTAPSKFGRSGHAGRAGSAAGILILEAKDLNHTIQLMSNHPGVRGGSFEIRPAAALSDMVAASERRRSKTTNACPSPTTAVRCFVRCLACHAPETGQTSQRSRGISLPWGPRMLSKVALQGSGQVSAHQLRGTGSP